MFGLRFEMHVVLGGRETDRSYISSRLLVARKEGRRGGMRVSDCENGRNNRSEENLAKSVML